jgi:hypothetical protein
MFVTLAYENFSLQNSVIRCEISSSHGGKYQAQNFLGCTAMFLIECQLMFWRCVLPPSSGHPLGVSLLPDHHWHHPGSRRGPIKGWKFSFSLIALMMEAARTSEATVDIKLRTWQYIPEDSELQLFGLVMASEQSTMCDFHERK